MILSNEVFLKELTSLFNSKQIKGSIFLTTKRFTYEEPIIETEISDVNMNEIDIGMSSNSNNPSNGNGNNNAFASSSNSNSSTSQLGKEYPCLIRATDGEDKKSKVKLSTLVEPKHYEEFTLEYGALLKSIMASGLKKKKKAKLIGKKNKKDSTIITAPKGFRIQLPNIIGKMRGMGVNKRKRSIKRREKVKIMLINRQKKKVREDTLVGIL